MYSDKITKEMLNMFLSEQEAYNLSSETIKTYNCHCRMLLNINKIQNRLATIVL